MPATYSAERYFSREKNWMVEHDPAGASTDPVVVDLGQPQGAGAACISLTENGGLRKLKVLCLKTVGTGNTDELSIIAATAADGTGATVVVQVATATAQTQNAVGDVLVLECDIDQIREVLAAATHVGVRHEAATGTDEWAFALTAEYLHAYQGLTANYIS